MASTASGCGICGEWLTALRRLCQKVESEKKRSLLMGPRQSAQIGELHTQACKMEIIVLKLAPMEIGALWAVLATTRFSSNVSVNISFTKPCISEGFGCKSVNACNLLIYGAGQVVPSSFRILKPNLMYSLLVSLSPIRYSRPILVMDRSFCTDIAGNSFTRMANLSVHVHIDRRKVYVNIRTQATPN